MTKHHSSLFTRENDLCRWRTFCLWSASVCLAFFYGAGAVYFKIFPYAILRDAKLGFDAWLEITRDNQTFEFVDEGGQPTPQVTQLDIAEENDSYILMTGDPYTLISECPKFGCIAWVMNRRGDVLHTWEVDLGQLWADTPDHT
jgi:hypothetical protein